jgi:hypothetical protein
VTMPDPPAPDPSPNDAALGYLPLRDLVGSTVEVSEVDDVDGVPIAQVGERWYLCSDAWATACATYLQGELASRGEESLTVRVVEERGHVGFRSVE